MSRRVYKGLSILGDGNEVFPPGTLSVNYSDFTINIHDGDTAGGIPLEVGDNLIAPPEEDFVITTRYSIPTSPPGPIPTYTDRNFTFGTDGTITIDNGIVSRFSLSLEANNGNIRIGYQPENPDIVIGNRYDSSGGDTSIRGKTVQILSQVPTNSKGRPLDAPGMISFDSNYMYVCVALYTNGTTDIWKRVALSGGTW